MTPAYYSITPANVRYDKRLTPNAKLLYSEITALSNAKGYCWASNEYFADLYDVDVVTVSRWIASLKICGYIDVEINQKEVNKRKIFLDVAVSTSIQKNQELLTKKSTALNNIVKCSIYSINNTINTVGSALNFVIENYPIRFEQEFLMPLEKEFGNQQNFDTFLKDFNDEAEMKNKVFGAWLIPMLKKYARKWIDYHVKANNAIAKKNNNQDAGQRVDEMYRKYASIG